ncbi:helix-turn-helix domain-containing protein [Bradyrhizobium sp. 153]|uniref:helix-turn-helix domain-containing protein n=1 Tax=Bradyrhizobium sp. 153 TaxID=2782627 RepID=UPI001FFA3ED2|nr:helix-turn-helix domain-containing protein [Bradyrhizobium sp. 153]MCK1668610.1 hypothetical protein [Bradyrhizobium sp. 153]
MTEVAADELKKDVEAYVATGGNRSAAARLRKLPRKTYNYRLEVAQKKLGIQLGKIVDGRVDYVRAVKRPLPKGRSVARYILSSVQNNTHPHPGFANLEAYAEWLRSFGTCEIILGSYSYAMDAYGAKAVKRGTYEKAADRGALGKMWYAPELEPYIRDESLELAPGLVWCGEMNILPTAANPLTGLEDYNGRKSNIIPHAKHALESVASLADEPTKFNYSTGTVTQRNYIQKRVGIMAERKHSYGALLVEVDAGGNWYVRQLQIGDKGEVYDIGPSGYRGVRIEGGKVDAIKITEAPARTFLEAITWGDIHAAEMELWVRQLAWAVGGMLDQLAPRKQFWHDVFSMRSRSHHEMKNFHRTYEKWVNDEGNVEGEMQVTADFMTEGHRPWLETLVVRSNHDQHLDVWLNTAKIERDPENARYYALLQHKMLEAIDNGERDFNVLEWALRRCGIPKAIRFLGEDESYVICRTRDFVGIECGLHGHLGPNGARGSTRALKKLGRPANKAHDHKATWMDATLSAGACSTKFPYMRGPGAHSISHIGTFENGARQILTMWAGKFRA